MSSIPPVAPDPLLRTAAVLVPGAVLALLSTTVAGAATPAIADDLRIDTVAAAWVTTSFLLAAAIGIAASGWLTRRLGVHHAWLATLGVFTIGAAASAAAPDLLSLTLARGVQGLGGGALEPIMLTALARAAGPARMGRVMGTVGGSMALGPILGPAVGAGAGGLVGWRVVFAGVAAASAIVLIASIRNLRDEPGKPTPLDLLGLALLTGGSMSALFGFSRAGAIDGIDTVVATTLLVGAALLVGYVAHARRVGEQAVVDLAPLRVRGFVPAIAVMGLVGAAVYPVFFGLPQYLVGALDLRETTAGLVMVPYGIGNLVGMPIAGAWSDRIAATVIVIGGAIVAALGFIVLATSAVTSPLGLAIVALVIGVGLAGIGGPTVSTLFRVLTPEQTGAGSALLFIVNQVGGALGVALLVIVLGRFGGTWDADVAGAPFWVPVATMTTIGLLAYRLPRQ